MISKLFSHAHYKQSLNIICILKYVINTYYVTALRQLILFEKLRITYYFKQIFILRSRE